MATHKVTAAAANVIRRTGTGYLAYRDEPIPDDAANLDALIAGGFVAAIDDDEDYAGGHPSDVPPEVDADGADQPRKRGSARVKDEPVEQPVEQAPASS